jgi:hypothetical protein
VVSRLLGDRILSCWDVQSVNLLRLMIAWSGDKGETALSFCWISNSMGKKAVMSFNFIMKKASLAYLKVQFVM